MSLHLLGAEVRARDKDLDWEQQGERGSRESGHEHLEQVESERGRRMEAWGMAV